MGCGEVGGIDRPAHVSKVEWGKDKSRLLACLFYAMQKSVDNCRMDAIIVLAARGSGGRDVRLSVGKISIAHDIPHGHRIRACGLWARL